MRQLKAQQKPQVTATLGSSNYMLWGGKLVGQMCGEPPETNSYLVPTHPNALVRLALAWPGELMRRIQHPTHNPHVWLRTRQARNYSNEWVPQPSKIKEALCKPEGLALGLTSDGGRPC